MDKIKMKLNQSEWLTLTSLVLKSCGDQKGWPMKWLRVMNNELLRQVYMKLHNRMHSLKSKRVNSLSLSIPEAAAFIVYFSTHTDYYEGQALAIVTEMITIIDQKLT